MSREDAARLALAIAKANGHSHPEDWVAAVLSAWDEPAAPSTEPPAEEG